MNDLIEPSRTAKPQLFTASDAATLARKKNTEKSEQANRDASLILPVILSAIKLSAEKGETQLHYSNRNLIPTYHRAVFEPFNNQLTLTGLKVKQLLEELGYIIYNQPATVDDRDILIIKWNHK